MKKRLELFTSLLLGALFSLCAGPFAAYAKTIPPAPYYYVLDEPQALTPGTSVSLQKLLIEHDHLAGEQIVVAIFKSLEGEDPATFTRQVFTEWKIGQRNQGNGTLLALYWKERLPRIEVGYGLEPELTEAQTGRLIEEILLPKLGGQAADQALTLAALEILRILESPLIESGKALEIMEASKAAGSQSFGSLSDPRGSDSPVQSALWLAIPLLSSLLVFLVLYQLLSAEAHFTGAGWFRPSPWRRGNPKDPMGAGGASGDW